MEGDHRGRRQERALDHPMREAILTLLGDHELTPAEIRERLPDEPQLAVVTYHVRTLHTAELVEVVGGLYRAA
jgi:Helix-turn-helix domain